MESHPDEVYLTDETAVVEKSSRVQFGNATTRGPLLKDVSYLDRQQQLVTKDVIYATCGFEGFYVRYSKRYIRESLDSRIEGPDFSTAKHLDVSLKQVTRTLLQFGKYIGGITAFIGHYDDYKFGKIVQSLCEQVSIFIDDYHQTVLEIEQVYHNQNNFSLNTMENILNQNVSNKLYHLYEICNAIHQESRRRDGLSTGDEHNTLDDDFRLSLLLMDSVGINYVPYRYPFCKGSLVLLIVQKRINTYKGDIHLLHYLNQLFDSILREYVSMLNNWLSDGQINDPFDEFMIKRKEVGPILSDEFAVTSEKYWTELFVIRKDGLIDQLMSVDIQKKILNTGKLLNMFKQCTGIHNFLSIDADNLDLIDLLVLDDLELKINSFHKRANTMMLKLIYDGYNFSSLLRELQNKFMLQDCYPSEQFIDQSFRDLMEDRANVSVSSLRNSYRNLFKIKDDKHNVKTTWERPQISVDDIVTCNQQFGISQMNLFDAILDIKEMRAFDPVEVLKEGHSSEEILNFALGIDSTTRPSLVASVSEDYNLADYAISLVELRIPLPFPYNFVIDTNLQFQYELVFKLLMLIRFLDHYNQNTWKDLNLLRIWRFSNYPKPVTTLILRCRALNFNIALFLEQLMSYINNDVINYNYLKLLKASNEIYQKIKDHRIKDDLMLNFTRSRSSLNDRQFNRQLLTNFRSPNSVFDNSLRLQKPSASVNRKPQGETPTTVEELQVQITQYLGTIINDTFLPRENIMIMMRKMFDLINSANHFLESLKPQLPTCNLDLYQQLLQERPEKISTDTDMSEDAIRERYLGWDKMVTDYMNKFNSQLFDLYVVLQEIEELELKLALILRERLRLAFKFLR